MTEKEQAMLNESNARWAAKNEFAEKKKKIVLALLQQCKDEGLTVKQVESVCETAAKVAGNVTSLRAGITHEGIRDFGW